MPSQSPWWNSDEAVAKAEALLGAPIPSDYLAFLGETGGSLDDNGMPLYVRIPLVRNDGVVLSGRGAGSLYDVLPMFLYEDRLSLLADTWQMADLDRGASPPWWRQLIPISDLSHTYFWCSDLRYDLSNPPIICVDYQGGIPGRPDPNPINMRWVRYVAPSFTQLLRQSMYFQDWEADAVEAFSQMDSTAYQFSSEVREWQLSTETYLARFGPVQSVLDAP